MMSLEFVSLRRYVIKRILLSIPTIFIIILIVFLLIHLAPGDPISILIGEFATVDVEYMEMMKEELGLNKPLHEQLLLYMQRVLSFDFGYSYRFNSPVATLIAERIAATLLLMLTGLIFAIFVGIILGVVSSKKPYSLIDNFTTISSLIAYSVPVFWLAYIFLLVFSLYLGLFPAQGMFSLRVELTGIDYVLDILHHAALPIFTQGAINLAFFARLTRSNMIEVMGKDFIITARAKGLDENKVVYRHALKNSLLPVVTLVGIRSGFVLSGSVLVETVFGWPGLGRLLYDSIGARDYPVIMALFIVASITVIIANLITDIIYAFIDPRVRYR